MFKIIQSQMIAPNMHLLEIEAPAVSRQVKPGQFVILRAEDDGERIPLSVSDWDSEKGTITIIFMNVGSTTNILASLESGISIPTVVGPLGEATDIEEFGTVICIGGCYGIGSIFPIARALKEKMNRVITILEARSSFLFYWEDKLSRVSDKVIHITRDGTKGYKGHMGRLTEIIQSLGEPVNRVIINGCTFLLKHGSDASRPLELETYVSLNPIMIDGTGMCGVCRVTVDSKTKFACVDGPDFNAHLVDWDELLQRRNTYLDEEAIPLRSSRCEEHTSVIEKVD